MIMQDRNNSFYSKTLPIEKNKRLCMSRSVFNQALYVFSPEGHILRPYLKEVHIEKTINYDYNKKILNENRQEIKEIIKKLIATYEYIKLNPIEHIDIKPIDNTSLYYKNRKVHFSPKHILFLDLDETLLYSSKKKLHSDYVLEFGDSKFYVNIRPYLKEFLSMAKENFNVILYTAGTEPYARNAADFIGDYFKMILCRDHCIFNHFFYLKDIRILGLDMSRCVILDNDRKSFSVTPENGINIKDFISDTEDIELLKMKEILLKIASSKDVRTVIKEIKDYNE